MKRRRDPHSLHALIEAHLESLAARGYAASTIQTRGPAL
jgi:hypothetical protein